MSPNSNLEHRIADYYEREAPQAAPDWLLRQALATIDVTPQRRGFSGVPRRLLTMNTYARFAAVAVTAVVVGVIGYATLGPGRSPDTGAIPSSTITPSAGLSPSPPPALTDSYTSASQGYTISYPAGWTVRAATESWTTGIPYQASPFADVIAASGNRFLLVASQPLGGRDGDAWSDLIASDSGWEDTCEPTSEPFTVDDESAVIVTHCDGTQSALVAVASRGYLIVLYGFAESEAWFKEILSTTQLDPARAVDLSPSASDIPSLAGRGRWITTQMVIPRVEGHTVTLLDNGKVLVAGGRASGGILRAAELFDPATMRWLRTGDMIRVREGHTATLLRDGRVLVVGGNANDATAELYDPATGNWAATASMLHGGSGHTATLLADGSVLVVGGSQSVLAEVYQPDTGTWTTTAAPGGNGFSTAIRLRDGRVLAIGHVDAALYDPVARTWTSIPDPVSAVGTGTVTLLADGRVLAAGGGLSGTVLAEIYDPASGTWTPTPSMAYPHAYHSASLLADGRVLVAGAGDGGYGASSAAEIYDPATNSWTTVPNMSTEHGWHDATSLQDGRVLVVGGFPNAPGTASAEVYDPG